MSSESVLRARSHWVRLAVAPVNSQGGKSRAMALPRGVESGKRSALTRMLTSNSQFWAARWWQRLTTVCVLVSFAVHYLATVSKMARTYSTSLVAAELATTLFFALDYLFRFATCCERRLFAHHGAVGARLRWAVSGEAVLAAVACVPVLTDGEVQSYDVALTLPRIMLLFRTSAGRTAVGDSPLRLATTFCLEALPLLA